MDEPSEIGVVPPDEEMMTEGKWHELPRFDCKLCPYSSLDRASVREHYMNVHVLKRLPPPERPETPAPPVVVVDVSGLVEDRVKKKRRTRRKRRAKSGL